MLNKEQIDIMLSMAKPETEQDKHLVECIRYDLYKMIQDYELHQKHFESEIKKFKYKRAMPEIEELKKEIDNLKQERINLIEENENQKRTIKSLTNHCKKLKKWMENQQWHKLAVKKLDDTQRLLSNYRDIERNLDEIEIMLRGNINE